MDANKKRRKTIVHVLVAAVIVSLATSLAFFANNINNNPERVALQTGTMALTFEDNDNGINAKLDFGSSVTKKFKIINTGTVEASLSLDWKDLVNTYLNRSLSYNLTYSEEENGTYQEVIPKTNMPVSSSPIRQALSSELSVPAGSGQYGTDNRNYYLYKTSNYWYWSLTPSTHDGGSAGIFHTNTHGNLHNARVHSTGTIAPVINISPEYAATMAGSGTIDSPYQIPGVE